MTENEVDEIQEARDYIYGYYCGRIGAKLDDPSDSWIMGFEDAAGIVENTSFVRSSAITWVGVHKRIIGAIKPRAGLTLYFESYWGDPIPELQWQWDETKWTGSGQARGWQKITCSATLIP